MLPTPAAALQTERGTLASIKDLFTPGKLAPVPGIPDNTPIFIVGMPRSGSTLLEQMLGSHSQVQCFAVLICAVLCCAVLIEMQSCSMLLEQMLGSQSQLQHAVLCYAVLRRQRRVPAAHCRGGFGQSLPKVRHESVLSSWPRIARAAMPAANAGHQCLQLPLAQGASMHSSCVLLLPGRCALNGPPMATSA
jgi:hypothetical protein